MDLATRHTERRAVAVTEGSADVEEARVYTYRLLARLIAGPPSAELRETLHGLSPTVHDTGLTAAWRALALAARRADAAATDDEYHALFIGLGRGEVVPYGSWYQTGFMLDQPLAVLRRDLAALEIERGDDVHEPEDHVSALCETMSLLIESRDEIPFETQRRFYNDHIGPWIGRFFRDLHDAPSARFYCAVAELGERFFEVEQRCFAMLA